MNVDFSKNGGAGSVPAPVIDVETQTTQTTATPNGAPQTITADTMTVPAVRSSLVHRDDLPGFRDVKFPRLNIVQNLGELKNSFSPGEVVFGQQTVLFTPPEIDGKPGNVVKPGTPPVIITVLGITQKRFGEIVVGGMGGVIVNSEADVRASGGTLDYKEWELKKNSGMKRFGPMNDLLVVVQRPECIANDGNVFGFEVEGKQYALALWTLFKTSYTEGYKSVLAFQRLAGVLKDGYPTHSFALSTREKSYPGNKLAWIPILLPNAKSTPAFMEFVNQIINPA